ncbi:hypothetical protein PBCV1_a179L [Paramecium bursaria Chlorella virus 1]|uniref:Uncharacterized protein n=1 Tax=Paramecium bursaria Chlorella virus 1 TaxID=10506 RepID=Q84499_PBCV1|nr:hypothetical protein PBCV1_a179L [Paramecium bursaria Chlorella virus 1]AAC96547.1 hypothetical protein [Paramecium bursaria Chlorella virus 1]
MSFSLAFCPATMVYPLKLIVFIINFIFHFRLGLLYTHSNYHLTPGYYCFNVMFSQHLLLRLSHTQLRNQQPSVYQRGIYTRYVNRWSNSSKPLLQTLSLPFYDLVTSSQ